MTLRAILAVAYSIVRAFHARQFKGEDQDKKGFSGLEVCGFAVGLTHTHTAKILVTIVEKSRKLERLNFCDGKFEIHLVNFRISS